MWHGEALTVERNMEAGPLLPSRRADIEGSHRAVAVRRGASQGSRPLGQKLQRENFRSRKNKK